MAPRLETEIDEFIERGPAAIDELLARGIDFLARLRSDDGAVILADTDGADYASFDGWELINRHPVRTSDIRDGDDGVGEVGTSESTLPVDAVDDTDGQAVAETHS